MQLWTRNHVILHHTSQLNSWQTGEYGFGIALDWASLRKKPVNQREVGAKLMPDDRGTQRNRVRQLMQLANELGLAVQIFRV
ncbi:hypothetical protein D9M70_573980 [compost metagenome]